MVTTSIPLPLAARPSRGAAALLSILGSVAAIGIVAVGLLVVPVAAAIVFGPSLIALF